MLTIASLHYKLAKCSWKLFSHDDEARPETDKALSVYEVTNEIVRAIKLLPKKKDPRRAPLEPIFEPHYKLVTVVHKMRVSEEIGVSGKHILGLIMDINQTKQPAEACDILQATPYAAKVEPVSRESDWEDYILKVLKNLRTADKTHWQHRIIARVCSTGSPR